VQRGVSRTIAKLLRRRSAIEPMIGHMKNDGRLMRCPLKGTEGDALFAVLCGCGHNIRMILRHLRQVLRRLISLIQQIFLIPDAEMTCGQKVQVDEMAP
jgi:IS5 family transposase